MKLKNHVNESCGFVVSFVSVFVANLSVQSFSKLQYGRITFYVQAGREATESKPNCMIGVSSENALLR